MGRCFYALRFFDRRHHPALAGHAVLAGSNLPGALSGLELWATTLVPALFPFMVIAEILLKIGVVPMLGVLLEPVMRPLFNLPGAASFVVAMGFTSGFPMGAVLTKRLCEEKQCTIAEGERLVAFTNNSSPLFILGAVAVGMFQYPLLGVLLAVAHYLANILIGILLGLKAPRPPQGHHLGQPLLRRSLQALLQAQKKRPPWAQMMRTAITNGVNNICLIGGFVIIFAILLKLLQVTSLQALFEYPCALFLAIIGLTPTAGMDAALATAFWEMTLGLKELSLATARSGKSDSSQHNLRLERAFHSSTSHWGLSRFRHQPSPLLPQQAAP